MADIDTFDAICLGFCILFGAVFVRAGLYLESMGLALVGLASWAGLLVPWVRERSRLALVLLLVALLVGGLVEAMVVTTFLDLSGGMFRMADLVPLIYVPVLAWLAPVVLTIRALVRSFLAGGSRRPAVDGLASRGGR